MNMVGEHGWREKKMDRWMDMNGWVDGWVMDGWMDRWVMDGWLGMDRWVDGEDGRKDRRMDGPMDGENTGSTYR